MRKAPTKRDVRIGVVVTVVFLFIPVFLMANSRLLRDVDFCVPYTGGLIMRQGNATRLYDLPEQRRIQQRLLNRPSLLIDPFPPFHAPLFSPLTRLGYRNAYIVWAAINIFLWVVFYCLIRSGPGSRMNPFRYLALSSLFAPLWIAIVQGQFSMLVLVAFALAFLYLKQGRDILAGFALGLGLVKFQAVLPFAAILLLRKKWRFISGLAGAAALLGVVSVIAVGWQCVVSYANLMSDFMKHASDPVYAVKPWNMPTVRGFVTGLLDGRIPNAWISVLWTGVSGSLILITACSWELDERRERASFDLMFAAALVVAALTAPHLLAHDLTPIAFAAILVLASPEWAFKSRECLVIAFAIGLLYASPLYLAQLVAREKVFVLAPVLLILAGGVLVLAGKKGFREPEGNIVQPPFEVLASPGQSDSSAGIELRASALFSLVRRGRL